MSTRKVPKARHDTVILKRQYAGRIIDPGAAGDTIAGGAAAKATPMVVYDVGPGTWGENGTWIPCVTKVGDEVFFRGEAEGRLIDGEKYWFTRDCHVFGVVEEVEVVGATKRFENVGELCAPQDGSEN